MHDLKDIQVGVIPLPRAGGVLSTRFGQYPYSIAPLSMDEDEEMSRGAAEYAEKG